MSILTRFVTSPPDYTAWVFLIGIIGLPITHWLFLRAFESYQCKSPPSASYRIPFLDHTRAFAEGGARLCQTLKAQTGARVPLLFNVAGTKVVLLTSPNIIRGTLYNTSVFATNKLRSRFVRNVLKYTRKAARIIENDTSGGDPRPLPGSRVAPSQRILRMQHESTFELISSKHGMAAVSSQFSRMFEEGLMEHRIGSDWKEMHDLFVFIRELAGHAGIGALCGPQLFKEEPQFLDLFWTFDTNMHFYHMGYPEWLRPKAKQARQRCMQALSRWRRKAIQATSEPDYSKDKLWDEHWGFKGMRLRNELYDRFGDIDDTGRNGADLGFLWAANCNLVNSIYYFILALLRDESVRKRCLEEMEVARIPSEIEGGLPRFDYNLLMKQPLLQSVLNETLRTEVTSLIARTIEKDHKVDGYTLPKNALSCVSIAVEHNDKSRWETRPGAENHPVEEFWPERFLDQEQLKAKCPHQSPQVSMKNLEGTFIPFGIGHYMCPGRHFAVRTIVSIAAMFIDSYEVQPKEENSWDSTERDYTTFGYAILRPVHQMPFRIRRKA